MHIYVYIYVYIYIYIYTFLVVEFPLFELSWPISLLTWWISSGLTPAQS